MKNGVDVRIDKKDYDKIKEYGDRYLERCHPFELEKSREERERKEQERIEARKKEREAEREQRIRDGLELPAMHKKIIREMFQPYEKWKEMEQKRAGEAKELPGKDEPEKPYFQDTITAAGKEWSKQNSLAELQELNQYLWDNYDERIEKPDYKKLVAWIKEKERLAEKEPENKTADPEKKKDRDSFEYKGEKYSKDSSYEKLTELAQTLRENKKKEDRLPIDDYQNLRQWIEAKDRARWAGALEKQMDIAKTQEWQKKARDGNPENFRYVNPLQSEITKNPLFGLWMQGASMANELVRSIPLDDRYRDYYKEAIQELEEAKKGVKERALKKGETGGGEASHTINKLDEAIDEKLDQKKEEEEKKKQQKKKNPFERDQWGRY